MKLDNFYFVQYKNLAYPDQIRASLKEVPGHFDKTSVKVKSKYSLHTEYSFAPRKLNSDVLAKYDELRSANKRGIPQLWKSEKWAEEFAAFVIEIIGDSIAPTVIEVHPPFKDYCSLDQFIQRYLIFEATIRNHFPDVKIVIENRAGSQYGGTNFLFNTTEDLFELCKTIKERNISLGIVLDFPQLLTAENLDTFDFDNDKYQKLISKLKIHADLILGIHMWGKKIGTSGKLVSHVGDLNTYFDFNDAAKNQFKDGIDLLCNDGIKRYFVPEVNSGQNDFNSMFNDLFNL